MIPFKLNHQQFSNKFRQSLDTQSAYLIKQFRTLIATAKADVLDADINLFLQYEGDLLIIATFDYYGYTTSATFDSQPLPLFEPSFNKKLHFHPDYFLTDFGGLDLMADELRLWVSECWWKAGGWDYPIYTYLNVHDDFGNGDIIQLTEKMNEI